MFEELLLLIYRHSHSLWSVSRTANKQD